MKLSCYENQNPEIFYSVQGEGVRMGTPSVFVRLAQCNLYCHWCDTDYTWNFEDTPFQHKNNIKYEKNKYVVEWTPKQVAEAALEYPTNNFVLTGGEPMLQQAPLIEFMYEITRVRPAAFFEVETNGTILPDFSFDKFIGQYNVSVKLSNSKVKESLRLKPKALIYFSSSKKSYFKFVVTAPGDVEEIHQLKQQYSIPNDKIVLMPEGTSADELSQKAQWLTEVCLKHNYKLSDRLHVKLYGSQRGV